MVGNLDYNPTLLTMKNFIDKQIFYYFN